MLTCPVSLQYRPTTTWGEEQLVITEVQRDRAWFSKHLPTMREFYDRWMLLKKSGVQYVPKRRPRKEIDLKARPRKPFPFLPSLWLLDRVQLPSGGQDEFTAAPQYELVRKAALQVAVDAAAVDVIPDVDP